MVSRQSRWKKSGDLVVELPEETQKGYNWNKNLNYFNQDDVKTRKIDSIKIYEYNQGGFRTVIKTSDEQILKSIKENTSCKSTVLETCAVAYVDTMNTVDLYQHIDSLKSLEPALDEYFLHEFRKDLLLDKSDLSMPSKAFKWKKNGTLATSLPKERHEGYSWDRKIVYRSQVSKNERIIDCIDIYAYKRGGFGMQVHSADQGIEEALETFSNGHLGFVKLEYTPPVFQLDPGDKTEVYRAIEVLRGLEPALDNDFFVELKKDLLLEKKECDYIEECASLFNKSKWSECIELAVTVQHTKQYYEVIWKLIHLFENSLKEKPSESIANTLHDLYKNVISSNPHYQEANCKLFHMYYKKVAQSPELKADLLAKCLHVAIEAKDSCLVDEVFRGLCGTKNSFITPSNIKLDVATLLQLANIIMTLNNKVVELTAVEPQQQVVKNRLSIFTHSINEGNSQYTCLKQKTTILRK